ncbi:uncharacterized protein FRV6_08649 [Fusarium oxysporum]|uniref:Uncharacterized protein n=1 Tax=Fusarium oxysporum TaxID=5507 RepID=A0A2H3T743_FUSOX|nr:uncharacterized protein FRV6_08649 [Fusarium oxysporum]
MDQKAISLVLSINEGTADIHGTGVDVCKDVPVHDITPTRMYQFCEAIAADIFHSAGIQKHEAEDCFNAIAERINNTRLLGCSKLERYEGMSFLRQNLSKVMRFQAETEKIICPPAHTMGCIIAAIAYRKLQPANEEFFQENEDLVKVFGELNGIQWLSVAIQVWAKVRGCAFAIELDENSEKPVAEIRKVDSKPRWVVTTRMPDINRYEGIFRNALCPAVQDSGLKVPKLEPGDSPLPSVEPNDTSNELCPLSDDDKTEDNVITLRDYTRQMKSLGKRLSTPDRAIVKRLRREILKKPEQLEQLEKQDQEVGFDDRLKYSLKNNTNHRVKEAITDAGLPQEYFDSYTHYKDVWKTCLQNHVAIPNSLPVLVDHYCTPSQAFHLTELEKDHLAEMEKEVDV